MSIRTIVRTTPKATTAALATTLAVIALAFGTSGCSTNPATGKSQLAMISEAQEIEIGKEADGDVVASLGLVDDPELQSYFATLGKKLAADSERPHLPWTFRVVDDPVVNAFAIPGGFIYVTRGLLGNLTSEAELAAVVGHEIGHVTARHSVEQMSRQQLAQIGLLAGAIASPEFAQYAGLAETGLGLAFLKYGRDDERQADDLGLRYLVRHGYDPREMPPVFATLARVSQQQGAGRVPGWLATHPSEESRISAIEQKIRALNIDLSRGTVGREPFLAALEGLAFGENPREGYFLGERFIQPDLGFEIQFPAGWKMQNQKQQVAAMSPKQDAIVALSLAAEGSPQDAARKFFSQQGIVQGQSLARGMDGLPSVAHLFEAQRNQGGNLNGVAGFVEHGGKVFQLLAYTGQDVWRANSEVLADSVASFRRVRDRRLLDVQPKRIALVAIPNEMTIEEFARRYPSTVDVATLAIMNQVEAGQVIPAGTRLKRVIGGELPSR